MAKIKFNPAATPLNQEHYGFTFQRNAYGHSMFPAGKNDRKRYPLQHEKMQYLSKAIRNWRNMSTATKNAWNLFAATFPQPTETDPNQYLSGYQLFIKRNYYRFLHEGIEFDFLYEPELSELPVPNFEAHIADDGMCIDVTEEYIRNHGILPKVGQFIICRIIPMATDSGQFFAPLIATLEVQEVYIDGLITSFHFSPIPEKIVFSLYMSRPVYQSNQYAGTKFRYMGCFKPTKFIQLTDTPDSYEAQAGKIVAVKDDETGLEFIDAAGCEVCPPVPGPADAGKVIVVNPAGDGYELAEGGGGGFDCSMLLECPVFVNILNSLTASTGASVPPVKFGFLYNWYAGSHPLLCNPATNFVSATKSHYQNLIAALGGTSLGAAHLKEVSLDFWQSLTGNEDNSSKMNCRGAGNLDALSGSYTAFKQKMWFNYADNSEDMAEINNSRDFFYFSVFAARKPYIGKSVRLCDPTTTKANGSLGTYVGNDGRIYRTIVINGIEWLADNLAETKFSDGSVIPIATSESVWAANYLSELPMRGAPQYTLDLV